MLFRSGSSLSGGAFSVAAATEGSGVLTVFKIGFVEVGSVLSEDLGSVVAVGIAAFSAA